MGRSTQGGSLGARAPTATSGPTWRASSCREACVLPEAQRSRGTPRTPTSGTAPSERKTQEARTPPTCRSTGDALLRRAATDLHDRQRESYAQLVGTIQKIMLAILDATRKNREDMTGDIFGGARSRRKLVHATAPTLGDQATARKIRQNAHACPNMGNGSAKGWRAALRACLGGLE